MSAGDPTNTDTWQRPVSLQHCTVDGLAVRRRRPDAPAATVVFVHGAMDRAASFGRVMRRLGDLDVIAYDRRGYAGSLDQPPTAEHRPAEDALLRGAGHDPLVCHARDLAAVLRWATADDPGRVTAVVGHSLGGLIALVAAGSGLTDAVHPTDLSGPGATVRTTHLDATCVFEAPLPWLDAGRVTSGTRAIEVGRSEGPQEAAEFFYRSMVGDATWERLSEHDRAIRRSEGPALLEELIAARRPRQSVPLPAVTSTLHVARGEQGPAHLRTAAEALARAAGVSCEVLPGAHHGAHLSSPGEFARWVRASTPTPAGSGGGR